jgi:hypothetical protein
MGNRRGNYGVYEMSFNAEAELFKIFMKQQGDHGLFKDVIELMNKVAHNAKGEQALKFYEYQTKLMNSINNAGWEERHSDQIQTLFDMGREFNAYEDFLP